MNLPIYRWTVVLLCLIGSTLRADDLIVSAAISMKDALTATGTGFEKMTGDHVAFNFLASGPLMKQIEQGAPVDVFVSAAETQMDELEKRGLIDPRTRVDVVTNDLVVITPASSAIAPPANVDELKDPRFKRIAIGEAATVPAGAYAMQTLKKQDIADAIKDRLKTGVNVRQVLDYVIRGEVDVGLVYRTDAMQAGDQVKIACVAPEDSHDPIRYPAAVIKSSAHAVESAKFVRFMSTEEATAIFRKFGFGVPPSKTPATHE